MSTVLSFRNPRLPQPLQRAAWAGLFVFGFARAEAAEPLFFIQFSDPQFGMCAANADVQQETANFAVSPILSLVVSCFAGVLLLAVAARGLGFIDENGPHLGTSAAAWLVYLLPAVTIVLPAAALTAVYYGLARWAGIGRRWILVSCLVISVLAGLTMCSVTLSDTPGQSSLTYGLGVPSGWHMLQALVPLALGVWLWRRTRTQWLGQVPAGEAIPT